MTTKPNLSIITATYNAEKYLPSLIKSLENQTCKDFEWIVADGQSTDKTLDLLNNVTTIAVDVVSEYDSGIFDAFNKAVKRCRTPYYLTLGADDSIVPEAIAHIVDLINNSKDNPSFLTFDYLMEGKVISTRSLPYFLVGSKKFLTGHSVGTVIKKDLHTTYGYYDTSYKIAADTKFLLLCLKINRNICHSNFLIGQFGAGGVSNKEKILTSFEFFRTMIETGHNKFFQSTFLYLRLLKIIILS